MSFEIIPGLGEPVTLDDLCQTSVPNMYLNDLGKIPSGEILDNYLDSTEQVSLENTSLYNKIALDTHIPPSSPSDFSILRTTADNFLQSYKFDGCTDRHIALGKNSRIVNSSLVNEGSSSAVFPPFFNSLLNPIFYIASLSNLNVPLVLLSGGYVVRPAGNSSQGGTVASTQHTTTTGTDRAQYDSRTTGTALGHKVGDDGDGDDPRHPRNFKELQNDHYRDLTEIEFKFLLQEIFRNQLEHMSEDELRNLLSAFHFHDRMRSFYQIEKGRAILYKSNWESDYLFLRNFTNPSRPRFFVRKRSSRNQNSSDRDLYVLNLEPHIQSLISSHVNQEQRNRASLASNQSSRSSVASSRLSERSYRSGSSVHFHSVANASAAPVAGAVAGAQAEQVQGQQQGQLQNQIDNSQNNSSPLQTWLPILMGIAGAILLGQEFSVNLPHHRNRQNQLRSQGQNRGRQDFVDDLVQFNGNRNTPWGSVPIPTLENEVSSLSLEDENNSEFTAGQAEGYRLQQRDYQREHPRHRTRVNEISRTSRRPNQVQFNTGSGFSINHQALIGILFELGSVLLFRRNRNKSKNKDTKKKDE